MEDVCVRKFVHVRMAGELPIVLIAGDVCVRKCVHVRMVVGLALRFLFVLHMVNLKKVKKSLINWCHELEQLKSMQIVTYCMATRMVVRQLALGMEEVMELAIQSLSMFHGSIF